MYSRFLLFKACLRRTRQWRDRLVHRDIVAFRYRRLPLEHVSVAKRVVLRKNSVEFAGLVHASWDKVHN